jgi:Rrf2 family transcriptional regulator, nitric oxide-sensitive transcriptional repressor
MISHAAEYALRAMLLLASRGGEPLTTSQLAAQARIPGGYLAKVLQVLVRAGLVSSQRGVNGGFVLGRPAVGLTLMDIVRAVDPSHRIRCCPLGIPEHVSLCPLHRRIDAAVAAAEAELRGTTLSDLVAQQADAPPCQTQAAVVPSNKALPQPTTEPATAAGE